MEIKLCPGEALSADEIGAVPRNRYPLVVIIARDQNITEDNMTVGAMVNVIHIQDEVCAMPSCIMVKYLKMTNGRTSCLQQLYMNEGETNYIASLPFGEENTLGDCVVCSSAPVTHVLLPCRHACVCFHCFTKIATCPLCRSQINTYFLIKDVDDTR